MVPIVRLLSQREEALYEWGLLAYSSLPVVPRWCRIMLSPLARRRDDFIVSHHLQRLAFHRKRVRPETFEVLHVFH